MCQQPSIPLMNHNIVFYGAGSMAEAIVRGMISRSIVKSDNVIMLNRSSSERLAELRSRYGVIGTNDPEQKQII